MKLLRPTLLFAGAALALFVAAACDDDSAAPPACPALTGSGCPEDNGADVCQDPSCSAIYQCNGGTWALVQACPNYNPDAAGIPTYDAGEASTMLPEADIDAPIGANGGPGCVDLESPDCTLDEAIACANSPGCCDCQDLYICQNGNWIPWGECTDAGVVPTK